MPRGDGTGPNGLGPMTGRAAGYCAGYMAPGYLNPGFGLGYGWGRGGGRGFRRRYWATGIPGWARFPGYFAATPVIPAYAGQPEAFYPLGNPDPAMEARVLTHQIEMMEQSLKNAKERLNELQKNGE
ncbi:MAG: DUF5320 domain-containing protein [Firmicutes bacterium]|nr:DUF5320 domain-containing protein [Bacillota bacterium]